MTIENACRFFKSFGRIEWTTGTRLLVACPFLLSFILLHLLIFLFDEEAGSVVSNDKTCVAIGKDILKNDGSVVDAAIATMLCEGVVLPNRAGIGGGFTAIMYISGSVETISATPVVPQNFPEGYIKEDRSTITGAKAGGVPGELRGYWEMHQKYGLLSWKKLFEPTIRLCEEGIPITEWLEVDMERTSYYLYRSETMRKLYRVLMDNNDGKTFKFLALAKTLKRIANEGIDVFYNGEVGKDLIEDIKAEGGLMTEKDLKKYKVSWSTKPIKFSFGGHFRAYTTPLPSMGAVVALTINIVKSLADKNTPTFWHMTVEALKHAFGHSFGLADIENEEDENFTDIITNTYNNMIDMDFAVNIREKINKNSVHRERFAYGVKYQPTYTFGSSNICIISTRGDAIVLTSSLMWDFGSFFWSPKTGILVNNLMRSFTSVSSSGLPPSRSSYVRPGKRALSPHAPTIVMNRGTAFVNFLTGAAGSELIPTQVVTTLIHYSLLKRNAFVAANSGFYHPDVLTGTLRIFEPTKGATVDDDEITDYLKKVGHSILGPNKQNPYTIRTCIGHLTVKPDVHFTYHQQGGSAVIVPEPGLNTLLVIILVCIALAIISIMMYEIINFERAFYIESSSSDEN